MTIDDTINRMKAHASAPDVYDPPTFTDWASLYRHLSDENARLRGLIAEVSNPDFLFVAMDNVHDMDTTLTDFADAASRAIRVKMDTAHG